MSENFNKYSSLENHYNNKFIEKVRNYVDPTISWCAREKIHGTNFSVIVSKENIVPCKRTGPILEGEGFFGFEIVLKKYKDAINELQKSISGNVVSYQVFGEFAGGGIQKGVDYGEKDFYVYDMIVNTGLNSYYTDDFFLTGVCNLFGFKMAPLLGVGKFEDLSQLPNMLDVVVNDYNLMCESNGIKAANSHTWNAVISESNIAEGYVLKPCYPMFFPNGTRIAIKCKNSKFSEKSKSDKPIKKKVELTEKDCAILSELSRYVTPARISNVVSHIGTVTAKDFGKVCGLTIKDIYEEASREDINILDSDNPDIVKKELQQQFLMPVLRSVWHEYL